MCVQLAVQIEHIYIVIFEHIYHVKGNMEYLSNQSTKMEHEQYVRTRFGVKLYFCSVLTFSLYFKYVLFYGQLEQSLHLDSFSTNQKEEHSDSFQSSCSRQR